MSQLIVESLTTIRSALEASGIGSVCCDFDSQAVENRSETRFCVIGIKDTKFGAEVFQSSTVKFRTLETTFRCTLFGTAASTAEELINCFENHVCSTLFSSAQAIGQIGIVKIEYSREYERMALYCEFTANAQYIYS